MFLVFKWLVFRPHCISVFYCTGLQKNANPSRPKIQQALEN